MRPALIFSEKMSDCKSEVRINYNGKTVNAKSIMSIMSAGIGCGARITLECSGEDEEAALKTAENLIISELCGVMLNDE